MNKKINKSENVEKLNSFIKNFKKQFHYKFVDFYEGLGQWNETGNEPDEVEEYVVKKMIDFLKSKYE